MRIGLLIYDLRSGGAERVLCKWSELLSHKHEIVMYVFDGKAVPAYNYCGKLRVIDAPSLGRNRLLQVKTLIRRTALLAQYSREDQIDLLISFCSTANFPTMFQRIQTAASIRLYSEYFSYRRLYRFLIKYTRTQLIVQTNRLKEDILEDIGRQFAQKIHVIGNPLDLAGIADKMTEEPEESFIQKVQGKKVICFTASFKTSKNHWNLIKSFHVLHSRVPDAMLVLIGGEGELEARVRKMVSDNGLDESVVFVGKTRNPFKYEKYANLFVLPSLVEGIPNVLIEAMAVGLPVVATDCPSGPREVLFDAPDLSVVTNGVEPADYGILVEPFPAALDFDLDHLTAHNYFLAEAMEKMLLDRKWNLYYRKKAAVRVQNFDMEAYEARLQSLADALGEDRSR